MVIYNGKKGFSFPKALVVHALMYLSIAALFFALGVTLNSGKTEIRTTRAYVIPYRVPVVVETSCDINNPQLYQMYKYYLTNLTYRTQQMMYKMVAYLERSIHLARAKQQTKVEIALAFGLTP